jgi:predicted ATPase
VGGKKAALHMQIESIVLKRFKRFHELKVELPAGVKLVILAGQNGTGKSSLFDGLQVWHRNFASFGLNWDQTYFPKSGESDLSAFSWNQHADVRFHDPLPLDQSERRKLFSFRSAYRNDPQFEAGGLSRQSPLEDEVRFTLMIENDAAVARNYQRIAARALEDVFVNEDAATTVGEFREKVIGDIRAAMARVFPALVLNDLGNPLMNGTFRFDKGTSRGFPYKNLSGGEKAAFDLLLDFILKARTFTNAVYCIDEPEAHMNSRVQAALLDELYRCLPFGCQMWLASHSVGMMRRARDIAAANPGKVAFLDFYDIDFDSPQVLRPASVTRRFWERILDVALDDLATLVAPKCVVLCEGTPLGSPGKNSAHDATCYDTIFEIEFPDTRFISAGNSHDLQSDRLALFSGIGAMVSGCKVIRLIDRDDHAPSDVPALEKQGLRVLSRRHLQCFLYDDSVLTALCEKVGKPECILDLLRDKKEALALVMAQGKPADDVKSAAGVIYAKAKQRLSLTGVGNDARAFERNVLAPLVQSGMEVYEELRASVFDSPGGSAPKGP